MSDTTQRDPPPAQELEAPIQGGISTAGGRVVVNFGRAIAWLALSPAGARELARLLAEGAERAEVKG